MTTENIHRRIAEYIEDMPSLPISAVKVLEICNNPQTNAADLNRIISLDPVLAGRVLKLLNSVYYGFSKKVTNMVRAIIMLGINTIKNLALSTVVIGTLTNTKTPQGFDVEGFWRHSLCVGAAAKNIAKQRRVDPKQIEEYFTAGLLHDIGKIPLNAVLSADYLSTFDTAEREQISLIRAEEKTLGITHSNSGGLIAKSWNLLGPIGEAIMYHHNLAEYQGSNQDILYSVALANYFAVSREIGFSGDRFPEIPGQEVWETLGISIKIFDQIEEAVNAEIEKAQVFLNTD